MLMVDECHLRWGDARGYVWGPRGKRVLLPIKNIRDRQTYYGAVNLLTGWTTLWEADGGNKENTVAFLTYLRQCFQGRRLVICWDGASYHRAHLVRDYVTRINGAACPAPQRAIHLIQFAPYAPVQNPMEDIWLTGKRAIRDRWADLTTFQDVKAVFSRTILGRPCRCEKLNWYGREHLISLRRRYGFQWE
jgi:transposase